MSIQNQLDILGDNAIKIKENVLITLTEQNSDKIDHDAKANCRILKFTSGWSFDKILLTISRLEPKKYPNLLVFIIEEKNFGFSDLNLTEKPEKVKILQNFLLCFSKTRPMVLQLTSTEQAVTRFYYKEENSEEFKEVEQIDCEPENIRDFPTFLCSFLDKDNKNIEDEILEKFPKIENSSLILRFLRTFELSDDFWLNLVKKCAESGSKSDLLAAIDAPLNEDAKEEEVDQENFLSWMIGESSVLHIAVQNLNEGIIDFLIKKCPNSIKKLPLDHQIEISAHLLASNQLAILCDLLELADFPFPDNFDPKSVTDEKLLGIIDARSKFNEDILAENLKEIEKFAANNLLLRFAYNSENKSAMCFALDSKKFKAFYCLKSLRFQGIIDISSRSLSKDERAEMSKFKMNQLRQNVNNADQNPDEIVLVLMNQSFIYNRNASNELEAQQHEKIREWFRDIDRTELGPRLLDAAAQCKNLKIIFDFECDSTEDSALSMGSNSSGVTYPVLKFIFIGAKLAGTKPSERKKREQQIKGVLAHEICHYVMRLVYQNNDHPYYKWDEQAIEEFNGVTDAIKNILFVPSPEPEESSEDSDAEPQAEVGLNNGYEDFTNTIHNEDECYGIISTVYTLYPIKDWHPELIVRPFHIQAQFDDEQKLAKLEEKFKILFEFCRIRVIPEVERFNLTQREKVQKFNNFAELLSEIVDFKVKLSKLHDVSDLIKNQLVIVTTNVPKLLLLNIYEHLSQKCQFPLFSAKNIFMNERILENSHICIKFKEVLLQNANLKVFVDSSRGLGKITEVTKSVSESKSFLLIVSNDKQCEELRKKLEGNDLKPLKETVNYNWMDLTAESKHLMLQSKVNFQNNPNFSLAELIKNETDLKHQVLSISEDLNVVIDDQLLFLQIQNKEIQINPRDEEEKSDKYFRTVFQKRNLIKKKIIIKEGEESAEPDEKATEKQRKTFFKKISSLPRFISKKITKPFGASTEDTSTQAQSGAKPDVARFKRYFEEIIESEEMSQEQMLEDVKNQKFVLISDIAGSGKSWMMKNFTNKLRELHPKKWTTYADLKQFIDEFKSQDTQREFSIFMAEKILKLKTKFEAEIFKKLYKNGKVCILFDGFDEIAPDCAEIVSKLFQSFQQNGGNQLWIATRDYFEVSLKKDLNIDVVYKLDEFTEQHGIELIVTSWMLDEMMSKVDEQLESDLINDIKSSPKYENYKDSATKISKKFTEQRTRSIGLPQFYKMIADISKDKKDSIIDLTLLIIFEECVDIQYTRWSKEKGKLRETANKESQHKDAKYHELHQFIAMQSLFPEESTFCDLKREYLLEWPPEEIIACGLLSKKGEKFFFPHETFREFYAAKFIIRNLTRGDMDVMKYFKEFLTVEKFGIIRMFLNEAFGRKTVADKIEVQISTNARKIYTNIKSVENLSWIFNEGLENLTYFVIRVLGANKNYKKIKKILFKNRDILMLATRNKSLFIKLQNFIFEYFDVKDFKEILSKSEILITIFGSQLEAEDIKRFIDKIESKTDFKFIRKELQERDEDNENLLFYLVKSDHYDENTCKLEEKFDIINKYLSTNELIKLAKGRNEWGANIFHVCAKTGNEIKLKFIWRKFEEIFKSQNIHHEFKQLFSQKSLRYEQNVLHCAARYCDKLEFHETLWELLLNTFENREELKDLILKKDSDGDNFVHCLTGNKSEIVEFSLNKIQEVFNADQYREIIYSKGYEKRNLLQTAAKESQNIKTHQILWEIFRSSCKSNEELLKVLKQVDKSNNNIFHYAVVEKTTSEIFEFMINQLEEITTCEEIRKLLRAKGWRSQNLLQIATWNDSFEFHESLWKIIRKYFDPSEILEMITYVGRYGKYLLQLAAKNNTKEVVELTCNEIKNSLIVDDESDLELLELKDECCKFLLIPSKNFSYNTADECVKKLRKFDSYKLLKKVLNQEISIKDPKILLRLAFCDKIEFHETLWEKILKNFENKEELKELILQKDAAENNFAHLVILNENSEVVEFTFKKIKDTFSVVQHEEILRSRGNRNNNLLHSAVVGSANVRAHQILWKTLKDSCKSDEKFLEILKEIDWEVRNFFHLAAEFTTSEVFEFMIQELEKIPSKQEIKEVLLTLDCRERNLLHTATISNKSKKLHEKIWEVLEKYLNRSEILQFINHCNKRSGFNILHYAVEYNTKEIVEFTWTKIKSFLNTKNDQIEYLKKKTEKGDNLEKLSSGNESNPELKIWVKNLLNEYEISFPIPLSHENLIKIILGTRLELKFET